MATCTDLGDPLREQLTLRCHRPGCAGSHSKGNGCQSCGLYVVPKPAESDQDCLPSELVLVAGRSRVAVALV